MLRRHLQGLLNYARRQISNAAAEEFNSSIQTIKANSRGFHSFQNYRIRILFHCGKLNMLPII
jgi:transposase